MAQERTPVSQQDTQKVAVLRKALVAEGMSIQAASDLAKILASALNAAPKEDLRKESYVAEPSLSYKMNAGQRETHTMGRHSTRKVATRQKKRSATETPTTNKVAARQQETPAMESFLTEKADTEQKETKPAETSSPEKLNPWQKELHDMETRLINRMETIKDGLINRMDAIKDGLNDKIDALKDSLIEKIHTSNDQHIRWLIGIGIALAGLIIGLWIAGGSG